MSQVNDNQQSMLAQKKKKNMKLSLQRIFFFFGYIST